MNTVVKDYFDQLKVGRKQSYKNLSLYPLLSEYGSGPKYLLLDEAMAKNLIEVDEVDSDGSITELRVKNRSPEMILIFDGEELVGPKQDRIVNTTIMVQGNATIVIPVSCVEYGRWSYDSHGFHSRKRMMSSNLRARKSEQIHHSIRSTGEFRADQAALWDDIAEKADRMEAPSPTGAMAAIYDKEMPLIQEYGKHFRLIGSQVGAIFMINGKVAGLDAFEKPDAFSKIFRKLIESYTLDAIDWNDSYKKDEALEREVISFREAALSAVIKGRPSVGLGTDFRIESSQVTGFALALDEQLLHVSVFAREDTQNYKKKAFRTEDKNACKGESHDRGHEKTLGMDLLSWAFV